MLLLYYGTYSPLTCKPLDHQILTSKFLSLELTAQIVWWWWGGGASRLDKTMVHINSLKSSHAVKLWAPAKSQTELSISLFFKLEKKNLAAQSEISSFLHPHTSLKPVYENILRAF